MKTTIQLLQINLQFPAFKSALLCFVSAFLVTLIVIPALIRIINHYKLYDIPDTRKLHAQPIPTMGGIAIVGGMATSLFLWFPFHYEVPQVAFFFSVVVLFGIGIMDDLHDLQARYKFMIQIGLASLIAIAGIRIPSFNGLFGIGELPITSQYTITVIAIVGITNAFNLVDGIDGLAGGLAFTSLLVLGLFLTICGDINTALLAFSLAGGVLAFLYFNFNPARIFMGDTGSLVLGFVIAVLGIRLMQVNMYAPSPVLPHSPIFVFGLVLIPVYDALRVFALRMWKGKSPFMADRTHIHHLLTNQGFSHVFATRLICMAHALILMEVYVLRNMRQELILALLLMLLLFVYYILKNASLFFPKRHKLDTAAALIKKKQ